MRFITTFTVGPGNRDAAIARFKQSHGAPPAGVTLLGRWHDATGHRGWTLSETSDASAIAKWVMGWSDLLTFETTPVLDDQEFGKLLGG
ncbi:MAG: DUF3303 family protein [Acidobacteria bacterium]|nr:DUF3303 family protein [Acidobacteriota bacterium]